MWLLFALTASVLWGLNYVLAEKVMRAVSPFTLMAFELLAAGVVVVIIGVARKTLPDDLAHIVADRQLAAYVVASVIVFTCADISIFLSIAAKNATVAGLVEISYPLFIALFTWLLLSETHLSRSVVVGGSLIFCGVLTIMLWD